MAAAEDMRVGKFSGAVGILRTSRRNSREYLRTPGIESRGGFVPGDQRDCHANYLVTLAVIASARYIATEIRRSEKS
jgi:hypothetical protein